MLGWVLCERESSNFPPLMITNNYMYFYCRIVNGFMMVVWIGQQVSGDMIAKLFGVTSQAQINMDLVSQGLNLYIGPKFIMLVVGPVASCIPVLLIVF